MILDPMKTDSSEQLSPIASRLKRFGDIFANETVLRGALHDLFSRLPNVKSVQVTHGSQELGKDLVFTGLGPLGETVHSACVAKNVVISGKVDSLTGAAAVLHQVRQALTSPFISGDGAACSISRVYVMSPFPISQIALRSIQGQLNQYPGQVLFYCGPDLLALFEIHYPEFLLLKSGLLTSYVDTLRRLALEPGPFEHLAFKHGMLSVARLQTARAYVRPTFSVQVRSIQLSLQVSAARISLDGGVRLSDLEALENFLNETAALAQFLHSSDVGWQPRLVSDSERIETGLTLLAKTIREKWEAGLKKRGGERHAVRIRIEGLKDDLDSLIDDAIEWSKFINDTLKALLERLRQNDMWPGGLLSTEYLQYGVFRDLGKLKSNALSLGGSIRLVKYAETLMEASENSVLITAPAGYGKTSFCKWNALNDAERYAKEESDVIPVYVPLYRYAQSLPPTFEAAFFMDVPLNSLLRQSKGKRRRRSRIRLYADGLDEIPPEQQRAVVLLLKDGLKSAHSEIELQIVLTARDHVVGEWLSWLPRVNIDRLDSSKIRLLVSHLLNGEQSRIDQFFDQLKTVPSLQHLMGVGLLATLVVALFTGMTKLPESRTELYRIVVDLMCGGWDLAKGLKRSCTFPSGYKQRVLTHLASILHQERSREATMPLIRDIVVKDAPEAHRGNWEGFVADMIQDGLLIREGNAFMFNHLSFQEYLCARAMADPVADSAARPSHYAVREYMKGDGWWQEVATFYLAMSNRPGGVRKLLDQLITEIDPGKALREERQAATNRRDTLLSALTGNTSK